MDRGKNKVLVGLTICLEIVYITWHIYMQRVIYRSLWEQKVRQLNPRGAALLYISMMHLLGNIWQITSLFSVKFPNWVLQLRLLNGLAILWAINNYLVEYTGFNMFEKAIEWLKPKDKPNEKS